MKLSCDAAVISSSSFVNFGRHPVTHLNSPIELHLLHLAAAADGSVIHQNEGSRLFTSGWVRMLSTLINHLNLLEYINSAARIVKKVHGESVEVNQILAKVEIE